MRVVGLDCNSKSIAYGVIEDGALVAYGQVEFKGTERNYRVKDAYRRAADLFDRFQPDVVAIEDAVFVQNQRSLITLAYYFGAIIAASPVPVSSVTPMEWQNLIGNKVLNNVQKAKVKEEFPGKSDNWYKNKYREQRKLFTKTWVANQFGVDIDSDDVTDAVGIAYWRSVR